MQSVGSTAFTYDKDGIRATKTTSNGIISYVYNNGKLYAEIRGGEIIYYFYNATGICGARYKGADYVYEKNVFGDVIAVIKNGTDVAQYNYDAWGNVDEVYVNNTDDFAPINPIRYRGYYYDTETGLYYLLTRYYDANIGQFISLDTPDYLDPETIGGVNLYAYCRNNPVMYVDPTGQSVFWIFALIVVGVSAVIGGVIGGVKSAQEGNDPLQVFGDVMIGIAIGTMVAGLGLLIVGVPAVLITHGAVWALAAFSIGAAAFNLGIFLVDFFSNITTPEPIEPPLPSYTPEYFPPTIW